MNTCGGFFSDALDLCGNLGELARCLVDTATQDTQNHFPLSGILGTGVRNNPAAFKLNALVNQEGGIATVIQNHVGSNGTVCTPVKNLLGAPPVFLEGFTLPGENCNTLGVFCRSSTHHNSGRRVILCGENVATNPTDFSTQRDECLNQHCGLNCHVQRAGDASAL